MQFFKHSTTMSADVKMKRVIRKYGLQGYGLYNAIIEKIAGALSSDKPIPELEDTAQDIAAEFGGDTTAINEIMTFMLGQGLFEVNELTGRILCNKIYKFIDKSQTRSPEIRMMIEKYRQHQAKCRLVTDKSGQSRTSLIEVEVEVDIDKEVEVDVEAESGKKRRFTPPTTSEVQAYLDEIGNRTVNRDAFIDYYASKGWMIGKNKMKDWRAAVRTWIRRDSEKMEKSNQNPTPNQAAARAEEIRKIVEGEL